MCGRGRCTLRPDDFVRASHLNGRPTRHLNMDRYRSSYNVAPGFNVPVVRQDDEGDGNGVVLHCMKWGLVPSFTKKNEKADHFKMFNARSESIREKASFRRLIPKNRCLVSFEGFYEWKKDGSRKQPYYIHFKDGRPLVFAALFDSWKSSEGEVLYTFTIITTKSSSSLEWLHDRMPVILGNKESTDCWLNDSSSANLDKLLKPYEETDLAWYPVTPAMGKLSFDGPDCIKEIKVKMEETKTISQFFLKKDACAIKEPKLEEPQIKVESDEAGVPERVKEEPESPLTLGKARFKDEPIEDSQQKSAIEKQESPTTCENARMKGELLEQENEKKEPGNQDDCQYTTENDDGDNMGCKSSISPNTPHEKRDHAQFSVHTNQFAKESERQHTSPAKKRSKGADDKQPTIFSYFGRS
ncbi:hypothetical protein ACS0TY_014988 [Phlomoides rotata]